MHAFPSQPGVRLINPAKDLAQALAAMAYGERRRRNNDGTNQRNCPPHLLAAIRCPALDSAAGRTAASGSTAAREASLAIGSNRSSGVGHAASPGALIFGTSSLSDFPDLNFLLGCYKKHSLNIKIAPVPIGNFDHVQLHSHRPQNRLFVAPVGR